MLWQASLLIYPWGRRLWVSSFTGCSVYHDLTTHSSVFVILPAEDSRELRATAFRPSCSIVKKPESQSIAYLKVNLRKPKNVPRIRVYPTWDASWGHMIFCLSDNQVNLAFIINLSCRQSSIFTPSHKHASQVELGCLPMHKSRTHTSQINISPYQPSIFYNKENM